MNLPLGAGPTNTDTFPAVVAGLNVPEESLKRHQISELEG